MDIFNQDVIEICNRLGEDSLRFSGKNILITGGKGFLGRYLLSVFSKLNDTILPEPCFVTVLDNDVTSGEFGKTCVQNKNILYVKHDIMNPLRFKDGGFYFADYVIHCAGIASPAAYKKFPLETLEVATVGLKNVLENISRQNPLSKTLFFSSSEVYGDPLEIPTKEDTPCRVLPTGDRACYDNSKILGETICNIYHKEHGVNVSVVRPFNIFGPLMSKHDYRVLPNFANQIAKGEPVKIYGNGNQTRTYCYITDGITGFLQVLLKGKSGEAYNIGNPDPEISIHQLVNEIKKISPKPVLTEICSYPNDYPSQEPMRRNADITKANLHVGYSAKVDLKDGLSRFFNWAIPEYSK